MFQSHWKTRKDTQGVLVQSGRRRVRWIWGAGAVLLLSLLALIFALTPTVAQAFSFWSGWSQVPGPVATASGPESVFYGHSVFLFVAEADHSVQFKTQSVTSAGTTSWSGLSAVPGGGQILNAPSAVVFGQTLYLFAQGANDNFVWVNKLSGTTWSGWSPVPGPITTVSSPTTVVYQNVLYLFVRHSDESVQVDTTSDGTNWNGLSAVPGGGQILNAPSAAVYGQALHLFGQGANDANVWTNVLNGSSWSGWNPVPGTSGVTTFSGPSAAIQYLDTSGQTTSLYLFWGAANHNVFVDKLNVISWSGASAVPGGGQILNAPSAVAGFSTLELFARGTDGNVWLNLMTVEVIQ